MYVCLSVCRYIVFGEGGIKKIYPKAQLPPPPKKLKGFYASHVAVHEELAVSG